MKKLRDALALPGEKSENIALNNSSFDKFELSYYPCEVDPSLGVSPRDIMRVVYADCTCKSVFYKRIDAVLCADVVGVFDGAGKTATFRVVHADRCRGKNGDIRRLDAKPQRGNFWVGIRHQYRLYGCFFIGFMV